MRPYLGPKPGRDPVTRGGMWNARTLGNLASAKFSFSDARDLPNAVWFGVGSPEAFALQSGGEGGGHNPGEIGGPGGIGSGGGGGGGGPQTGGDGSGGGGYASGGGSQGSWVNTNTGNRCYFETLVAWPVRGGMSVDFTIFHNSQTSFHDELGWHWSWTYCARLSYTPGSSAIIRWGDGTTVPFEEDNGAFVAPVGVYDTLDHNADGTWTVTSKNQTKFDFNSSGALSRVTDSNGNHINLTLNGYNHVTDVADDTGRTLHITYSDGTHISSITDPMGRSWSFAYNIFGNLVRVDYPTLSGQQYSESFTYDPNHCMTSQTDANGKVWQMLHDGMFRLMWWKDPLQNTTTFAYNQTNTVITDPIGKHVTHNYSAGMIASVVDELGYSEAYQWFPDKTLDRYWDRNNKCFHFTYDSRGNMLTAQDPYYHTWRFTYDTTNNLTSEKDPTMTEPWEYHYDAKGNLEFIEDPLNRTVLSIECDDYGDISSLTNYYNEKVSIERDGWGNVWKIHDPANHITEETHDLLGNLTSVTNPLHHTYSLEYDEWLRPWKVTRPDSKYAYVVYDPTGNITDVYDELLRHAFHGVYDDAGRITDVYDALQHHTQITYDGRSLITRITKPIGNWVDFAYTDRGEPWTVSVAGMYLECWSYDPAGNVHQYQNGNGDITTYSYDDNSQLTLVDYPTGTDVGFTYDDASRLTQMTDGTGITTWTYNTLSQLTDLVQPQGSLHFEYDVAGRLITQTAAGMGSTTYHYDSYGRLDWIRNYLNETTGFEYDDGGALRRVNNANGTYSLYDYDGIERLHSLIHKNPQDQTLWSEIYSYDDVSNITGVNMNGVDIAYGYTDLNQLHSETRPGFDALYWYDDNGNRQDTLINGIAAHYSYDNADKLQTVGATTFHYDLAGRCYKRTDSSGDTLFDHDYEDRITKITYPNLSCNTFTYNGLGSRVGKSDSTGSYTFFRNGSVPGSGVISDGFATYTGALSERRNGASKWMHQGVSGSNVLMTDASGAVTDSHTFDAFGNPLTSSGSSPTRFLFGGGFGLESESDLPFVSLSSQFYDPGTGALFGGGFDGGTSAVNPVGPPAHRLRPMIAACDGETAAFLPDGPSPRTPLTDLDSDWWAGLQTGLAAVGSSLSFGIWDGGSYRDRPGFREAVAIADFGFAVLPIPAGKIRAAAAGVKMLDGAASATKTIKFVSCSERTHSAWKYITYVLKLDGDVVYVGHTGRRLAARFAEHLARNVTRIAGQKLTIEAYAHSSTRFTARVLEQKLMDRFGGPGGNLWNVIRAIARGKME